MTGGPDAAMELLIVGRIRRSHGVRGEVVVEIMTSAPDAIFASGARVLLGDVRGDATRSAPSLTVERSRSFGSQRLVIFNGVSDRNAADLLRDRYLLVPATEVEHPKDGEVFVHDLIGLTAMNGTVEVGEVTAHYESPAGLLLEIRGPRGTVLLPYRLEFVHAIDLNARRLVLNAPAGMFDGDA